VYIKKGEKQKDSTYRKENESPVLVNCAGTLLQSLSWILAQLECLSKRKKAQA
jgi:hypothetical protein